MNLAFTDLGLLASYTAVSVFLYIRLDIWPPVVSSDQFLGFIMTRVSGCNGVVMGPNDILSEFLVSWDINSSLPFDRGVRA